MANALASASGWYDPDRAATRTAAKDGRVWPVVFSEECLELRCILPHVNEFRSNQGGAHFTGVFADTTLVGILAGESIPLVAQDDADHDSGSLICSCHDPEAE